MKTLIAIALALVWTTALAQDKLYAARVEIHTIRAHAVGRQFLKGDTNGKPVTVTGQLRIAQSAGRTPVVILIHGSGGMGPNVELWEREPTKWASPPSRSTASPAAGSDVNTDQALLGRLNMTLDAYRMLDVLAKHPRVDPQRVALMGFSRGGQGTLYASLKRFHKTWNRSGIDFVAYVPFYPDCMTTYQNDADTMEGRPIRIFGGTPDDYNPVLTCRGYVERLKGAGRDVVLTEYPNAQHGFDNPLGTLTPTVAKNAQTVRNCRIREDANGRLLNAGTGQPFTYKDACVERDPHVGHDPAATQAVRTAVKDFYRSVFKLAPPA
jgi:dienelactone hydrolase